MNRSHSKLTAAGKSSYTALPIHYQVNPLENLTTDWDDQIDDNYSRSLEDSQSDDNTDIASSVYDNSPVVYRPPRGGKPAVGAPLPRCFHMRPMWKWTADVEMNGRCGNERPRLNWTADVEWTAEVEMDGRCRTRRPM